VNRRRRTTTSAFGVGAREGHDASGFYQRFRAPEVSDDDEVAPPFQLDEPFIHGDARTMTALPDRSVALVVTSPPYFAGKQYELELERDGIPASYLEYLTMLRNVFAECVRVLEPGGRLAVNVANLGRKPYRSLSADVTSMLEDDLGLLLRGEIIWRKAEGATGSCAWGSFRSATNPVLRDLTERVIVASKGRFDRARSPKVREQEGLPHRSTMTADDFMSLTLDLWTIPPESARRVNHPAPFPVELPEQLIRLYTYQNDLVLDPFMGSGSTMVAASRLGRRHVGYDLDPEYVEIARQRVATEGSPEAAAFDDDEGALTAPRWAERVLGDAGFTVSGRNVRVRGTGVVVDLVATNPAGMTSWILVAGAHTAARGGLQRSDAVWKAVGRAAALRTARESIPLMLMAPGLPRQGSELDQVLRAARTDLFTDVIDLTSNQDRQRLAGLAFPG
jgi:site-specific DNA-methyltransferase (adenine-specific)